MDVIHEITLSDEKFAGIGALRDLLAVLDKTPYCVWGSFLSCIHFKKSFSGSFDVLVADELDALDIVKKQFVVDTLHGTLVLDETNGGETVSTLKVRFIDAASKNEMMRKYLVEHTDMRTCVVASKSGDLEKFDVMVPRRGPSLLALLIEADEDPIAISAIVEKIVWSLENVGVAPLLREARYVPQECVYNAADLIEDLFVSRANKTATLLHTYATSSAKSMTAAELKKLGRPYAALLRA